MLALLKKELADICIEMHEPTTKIMTSFNKISFDFIDVGDLLLDVLPDGRAHKYLNRMLSCADARGKARLPNELKPHGEHFTRMVGG